RAALVNRRAPLLGPGLGVERGDRCLRVVRDALREDEHAAAVDERRALDQAHIRSLVDERGRKRAGIPGADDLLGGLGTAVVEVVPVAGPLARGIGRLVAGRRERRGRRDERERHEREQQAPHWTTEIVPTMYGWIEQ